MFLYSPPSTSTGSTEESSSINVLTSSEVMSVNNTYIPNNSSGTVELTLPSSASVGDYLEINGLGDGGWLIESNSSATSQKIVIHGDTDRESKTSSSSEETLLESENPGDNVYLVCTLDSGPQTWESIISHDGNVFTAWGDLVNASYDSKSISVNSQETSVRDVKLSSDGSKMYISGTGGASVFQYSLSTDWDISTATYSSKSMSTSMQDTAPMNITFRPNGSTIYVVGGNTDTIYQYDLSTDWDASTGSYSGKSFGVSSQDNVPRSMVFNDDGTKMYMVGTQNDTVYQYSLSTAWDISTASYTSKSFDVSSQENSPHGIAFNTNGTIMYIVGTQNDTVYQYSLSTGWDISTASYSDVSFGILEDDLPSGIEFKSDDGSKMYIAGLTNDSIFQYSL